MMHFDFREAEYKDLEKLLELLNTFRKTNLTVEQAWTILRGRNGNNNSTYVLINKEQIVATISMIVENKFIHDGGIVAHLQDLVVHPDFRNNGVGGVIMDRVCEMAKQFNCYKIILECDPNLKLFYEQCGFKSNEISMRKNIL